MQKTPYDIVIFLVVASLLFIILTSFIISILYFYRKRQIHYEKNIEKIKLDNEKAILSAQLEMQEQTFKHISREIHDNINLSLTLAKLNLHTLDHNQIENANTKIGSSIELITQSIAELSDISKSLNADIIIQHGLLKAIEEEVERIAQIGVFQINYRVTGNPLFMEAKKELVIFRIIQEAFNNIIKHASAKSVGLILDYKELNLVIVIHDNGNGFDNTLLFQKNEAGIKNMETRANILNGTMKINSIIGHGTLLTFTIPFK